MARLSGQLGTAQLGLAQLGQFKSGLAFGDIAGGTKSVLGIVVTAFSGGRLSGGIPPPQLIGGEVLEIVVTALSRGALLKTPGLASTAPGGGYWWWWQNELAKQIFLEDLGDEF